jgi:hypothetical protein
MQVWYFMYHVSHQTNNIAIYDVAQQQQQLRKLDRFYVDYLDEFNHFGSL